MPVLHRFLIVLVAGFAWFGAAILPASATDRETAAANVVDALIADVEVILAEQNPDAAARRDAVSRLLDTHFAMGTITAFSTGPYWRAATPQEREDYAVLFRDVLVGTVMSNFDLLNGLTYTPGTITPKGDRFVIVGGTFADTTGSRAPVAVNWRVLTREGKPIQIFDIEVENLSLLVTQQQENIAVIRQNKGQFAALIAAMDTRLSNP